MSVILLAGREEVGQVLQTAVIVLTRGVASSALQSAMFQALQKVPDLTVVDEHATDIEGRTGVALGLKPGTPDPIRSDFTTQLILDPTTGQYLGSRSISNARDGLIPAGTQIWADAIRTDVRTTAEDWTPAKGNRWNVYP